MKTIAVIFTNKKIETPTYQKIYCFNIRWDIKIGEMIQTNNYNSLLQVVEVYSVASKYYNQKKHLLSDILYTDSIEIKELHFVDDFNIILAKRTK